MVPHDAESSQTPSRDTLFEIIVKEHADLLRGYVRSIVPNPATADDIVQDVFIAAWRSFDTYDRDRPPAGWVSFVGDLNGDGLADVAVNAPYPESDAGRIYIFPEPNGVEADYSPFDWSSSNDTLANASLAGDVNHDGFDDLLINAALNDDAGADAGKIYLYSGHDGHLLYSMVGENPGDNLGNAVSPLGDVNLDGWPDYIVAARSYANGNGRCYVYLGGPDSDANGIPDICGLAPNDCNGNGIPDECDSEPFDVGLFASQLLAQEPTPQAICFFDMNADGFVNGKDIQPFVDRFLGQ